MAEWIERVDRATDPVILGEHVLRYRFALPAIRGSATRADVGCGNGAAAALATGGEFDGRMILLDADAEALSVAEREFGGEATVLDADLAAPEGVALVAEALEHATEGCVTCFEVIEHLENVEPLLTLLLRLAEERQFTVVLSVPNDAFTGVENPFHQARWGEGAIAELRSLLPEGHVVAHQYALTGSAIQPGEEAHRHPLELEVAGATPSHYLIAFGPRASELQPAASVQQLDLDERRAWERRREADLRYHERLAQEAHGPDGS